GQPSSRVAAPQGADGGRPGHPPTGRQPPDLPARPRRDRRAPRLPGPVLGARPGRVQGRGRAERNAERGEREQTGERRQGLPTRDSDEKTPRQQKTRERNHPMTDSANSSVRSSIVVGVPIDRAFTVFTED